MPHKRITKECMYEIFYGEGVPNCLVFYETDKPKSVFCPACKQRAYRRRLSGNFGKQHKLNPYNPPPSQKENILYLTIAQFQSLTPTKLLRLGNNFQILNYNRRF